MTFCNQCGGRLLPSSDAIVPALGCEKCGRTIPFSLARSVKVDKVTEKRALRAARRMRMRRLSSIS